MTKKDKYNKCWREVVRKDYCAGQEGQTKEESGRAAREVGLISLQKA